MIIKNMKKKKNIQTIRRLGILSILILLFVVLYIDGLPKQRELTDYNLKNCQFIQVVNKKLLVCFEKQVGNTLGLYTPKNKVIVLSDMSEDTIQHECIHFSLYENVGADLSDEKVQHNIIKLTNECQSAIKQIKL